MDAEHKFILILALLCIILMCIVSLVVFVVLWQYGLIIGCVLLSLVVLLFLLVSGVIINEQVLRHRRVKYHSELPLDSAGRPLYLYQEMKPYVREEPHYD